MAQAQEETEIELTGDQKWLACMEMAIDHFDQLVWPGEGENRTVDGLPVMPSAVLAAGLTRLVLEVRSLEEETLRFEGEEHGSMGAMGVLVNAAWRAFIKHGDVKDSLGPSMRLCALMLMLHVRGGLSKKDFLTFMLTQVGKEAPAPGEIGMHVLRVLSDVEPMAMDAEKLLAEHAKTKTRKQKEA